MSETMGDVARRTLVSRGLLYSGDVLDDVKARLSRADARAGTAMAAACASHLMNVYSSLPHAQQHPFTLQWGRVLAIVWEALASDRPAPHVAQVRQALDAFYAGPYSHSDGPVGPSDADEDAAAAAIYSAESLCGLDPEAAYWATSRLIDWAFSVAQGSAGFRPEVHTSGDLSFIEEAAHPVVQRELTSLMDMLALLEREGTRPAVFEKLRALFGAAG